MCSKCTKWPPCICIGAHPRTRVAFPRQAWRTPSPSQRASTCTQTAPLHANRTACSQHIHANRTGTCRPHRVRRITCGGPRACITTRVTCRPLLLPRHFLAAPSIEENGEKDENGGAWVTSYASHSHLKLFRPVFKVLGENGSPPTHI